MHGSLLKTILAYFELHSKCCVTELLVVTHLHYMNALDTSCIPRPTFLCACRLDKKYNLGTFISEHVQTLFSIRPQSVREKFGLGTCYCDATSKP